MKRQKEHALTVLVADTDTLEQGSEEGGDNIMLLDDEEDEKIEGTHTAEFKGLGVTATLARQDHFYGALMHIADGKKVEAILQQEQSNVHDPNAIQVVVGVGDTIKCVIYCECE